MDILNPNCFHLVLQNSVLNQLNSVPLLLNMTLPYLQVITVETQQWENFQDCFTSLERKAEDPIGYIRTQGKIFWKNIYFLNYTNLT